MEKIKSFFKNNGYILLSGVMAAFVILIIFACFSLIPFGDGIIYRMDLYHQYGPMFSELYDRLTSGQSLIYSWNAGLGLPFLGNFYNYLSSPLSFLIVLFGHKNTFEAVAFLISIKAVLSSMSMANYLQKSQKINSPIISAFGILYAFSGYFIAYYWNVMWIDAMYVLPFIALGIERIINKGKITTYLISLVYCIFANYYIGYMICIFSCLYFLYYYVCQYSTLKQSKQFIENKSFIQKIKNNYFLNSGFRFAGASLCAALILVFMLVPLAFILNSSSATKGTFPIEFKFYFSIFDFLSNHLASLEPTIRSSGDVVLPNIYCGMITVLLIPLYIFSNKITSVEKIASTAFLAIMYFSFNINYLNYIWHGFHFPNDLPYRQSFIYSFILIVLAVKAIKIIDYTDKKAILTSGISVIAFIILAQKITSKNVNDTTVYLSIGFVVLFTIVLGLLQSKKAQALALSVMILCSVTAETISASTEHYVANQQKSSFTIDYDDFKDIQSTVHKSTNDLFFREELTKSRARMDPSWFNYNGVSVFSSMAYEKVANFQKQIGLYGNKINSYTYNPQTPIYNAMFSIKYIYDKSDYVTENKYYTQKADNNTFVAYENNYCLNLAFPVSKDILKFSGESAKNPVEAQEKLFKAATGISNVFTKIYNYDILCSNIYSVSDNEKTNESIQLNKVDSNLNAAATIIITAPKKGNIYVYVYSRNVENVVAYSPIIQNTMTVSDGYILDLGSYNEGDEISIEIPLKNDVSSANVEFCAFTINEDKFEKGYNQLKDGQLEYKKFNETYISGNYTAEKDEILFTSIPYDKGWNVYVDGKRISDKDIIKISEALLGVKVPSGEHEIVFKFQIPYYNVWCNFSLYFVIILLVLTVLKSRRLLMFKKHKQNLWERVEISTTANITQSNTTTNTERIVEEIEIKNSDIDNV